MSSPPLSLRRMLRQMHIADDLPSTVQEALLKPQEVREDLTSARSSYSRRCRDFARPSHELIWKTDTPEETSMDLTRACGCPQLGALSPQPVSGAQEQCAPQQDEEQTSGASAMGDEDPEDCDADSLWESGRSTFAPKQPKAEHAVFESEASGPSRYDHLTMRRRRRHTLQMDTVPLFSDIDDMLCSVGSSTPRASRWLRTGGMAVTAATPGRRRATTCAAGAPFQASGPLPRLLTCSWLSDKATCEA